MLYIKEEMHLEMEKQYMESKVFCMIGGKISGRINGK